MFWTILRKELLENLAGFRFALISAITVLLVATSTVVMYRAYSLQLENYETLKPTSDQPVAIIPPSPLSIYVRGLEENLDHSFTIAFGGTVEVGGGQQTANALFRLFTTPDLLYVIKVILALAALLFAYNAVSGERENGTLKLMLSGVVRRPTLLAGKWAGAFLSLSVPLMVAVIASALVLSLLPDVVFGADEWVRLGLLLLGAMLYLAVFTTVGLLISSLVSRSSSALVFSLFIWTVLVFYIPDLGGVLARQINNVPSVQSMVIRRNQNWMKAVYERIIKERESPPSNEERDRMWLKSLADIKTGNDKLTAEYRGRQHLLIETTRRLMMLSPSSCFALYAMDLTGTGLFEEQRLKEAVLQYKERNWDHPIDSSGRLSGEFEVFRYDRTPVTQVLRKSGMSYLAIMFLFFLLAVAGAHVAFLRYDVR